ncbi:hypothetical protein GFC29_3861 (plasmid) [Anoxybacillus sp. B7M1]|nr:hypothetical protein GFC29_3861 [Anoxybacillus sp. B7M1]
MNYPSYKRRRYLISQLHQLGVYMNEQGRAISKMALPDLEILHIKIKCGIGRRISQYLNANK